MRKEVKREGTKEKRNRQKKALVPTNYKTKEEEVRK